MSIKQSIFRVTRALGANALVAHSGWRRRRLLILCYHGVSLEDEHLAHPGLYVSAEFYRRRLERLARGKYNVLSLNEGLARLAEGTLPPKAVVLTFDDGTRDFATIVAPMQQEFDMPATVYVTTYYCEHPYPVFDTALVYLLWRGRDRHIDLGTLVSGASTQPLASNDDRQRASRVIHDDTNRRHLSADDKQNVLCAVAQQVGVSFNEFLATGMYQQMTPHEVGALPRDLIDVQLHTHRHRTPRSKALFDREIVDNREHLLRYLGSANLEHFCYPSGDYWGEFVGWLRALGVRSATTTVPALAVQRSNAMLLPRFLDSTYVSDASFDAWTSGIAEWLPRARANRYEADRLAFEGSEHTVVVPDP